MIKNPRLLFSCLLTAVVALLLTGPAAAQVKSFYWESVSVAVDLQPNGDLIVTEQQSLLFLGDDFTFGFREIPTGPAGRNDGIDNLRVLEGDTVFTPSSSGAPYTYRAEQKADALRVTWYFPPTQGRHTYTFQYTVHGALRTSSAPDEGDQIFWAAIPADHPAAINNVEVTLRLPEGVAPQRDPNGAPLVAGTLDGSETEAVVTTVSDDGRVIRYTVPRGLVTGEQLDVRVQIPHALIAAPTPDWQRAQQSQSVQQLIVILLSALVTIGGPIFMLLRWYGAGRDPQVGRIANALSQPPDDLPPGIVGTLVDEKADMRDILATLLHLASRDYLTITETPGDFIFTRSDRDWDDLRPYEKRLLKKLFRVGVETTSLTSLKFRFASALPKIRRDLYREIKSAGLMPDEPDKVRDRYTHAAILLTGAALLLGVVATNVFEVGAVFLCLPVAVGFNSLFIVAAGRAMPRKTRAGAEAAARWQAFRRYLVDIDKYENLEEAGEIFNRYLPYAVAFGLERTWINHFKRVSHTPAPVWYIGPGSEWADGGRSSTGAGGRVTGSRPTLEGMSGGLTSGLSAMSGGLTRMLNDTATTFKSTPPSSSGSSSGGSFGGSFGGSSGGGSMGFG